MACQRYLEDIKKYREEGRHVYYLGVTWVNAEICTNKIRYDITIKSCREVVVQGVTTRVKYPTIKGKLIILHIGPEDEFVPGALICFVSKKKQVITMT